MIVVRMLLNSWATLEASAPTLLEPLGLEKLLPQLVGFDVRGEHAAASHERVSAAWAGMARCEQAQHPPLAIGIGCAVAPSSSKGTFAEKRVEWIGAVRRSLLPVCSLANRGGRLGCTLMSEDREAG